MANKRNKRGNSQSDEKDNGSNQSTGQQDDMSNFDGPIPEEEFERMLEDDESNT